MKAGNAMYMIQSYSGMGEYGDIWQQLASPIHKVVAETKRVIHTVGVNVAKYDPVIRAIANTKVGEEIARVGKRIETEVSKPMMSALEHGDLLAAMSIINPTTLSARMLGAHQSVIDALSVFDFSTALHIQDPRLKEKAMAGWAIVAVVVCCVVVGWSAVAAGAKAAGGYVSSGATALTTGSKIAGMLKKKETPEEMMPPRDVPEYSQPQESGVNAQLAAIFSSPAALPVAIGASALIGLLALKYK